MITIVTLLRLIPYALAGLLAWQKGYKRLTVAMAFVIFIAILNFTVEPSTAVRGILASIFALLLGWHAADLEPRKGR